MKLKFAFILVVLLAVFVGGAEAARKYVRADASAGDGESWTTAYSPTQFVALLNDHDIKTTVEIWVAAGTYTLSSVEFKLRKGIKLYGGFTGTESVLESRDWKSNETIFDGDGGNVSRSVAVVTGGANATSADTVIDGFTIKGGKNSNGGGGMYNNNSSPTVANCTFSENSATSGTGGGMHNINSSSPVVTNCTFSGNSATIASGSGGGGMYNNSSSPVVTNCTFSENSATINSGSGGGGMYNYNSSPVVVNTIFWGNTPSSSQIYHYSGTLTLSNDVISTDGVVRNSGTINSSDIIYADPKLGIFTNGHYPLSADSPAIDKGLSVGTVVSRDVRVPATDQLGTTRPQGNGVDIGSFEYVPVIPVILVIGVSMDKNIMSLTVVGSTEALSAEVLPVDATSKDIVWTSSNTAVATFLNGIKGMVTAVAAGTATITASSDADPSKAATCVVTVTGGGSGDPVDPPSPEPDPKPEPDPDPKPEPEPDPDPVFPTPHVNPTIEPPVPPVGTPGNIEPVKAEISVRLLENATDEQKNEAMKKVADTLPTIKPGDLEMTGGVVTVNRGLAMALASENMPSREVADAVGFPIFTAELMTEGGTAMTAFEVSGANLFASHPEDVVLLKVKSSSEAEFFTYTRTPSEFGDKCFTLMDAGGNIVTEILSDAKYRIVLFITDGGGFDLNGKTDGKIIDPVAIIKTRTKPEPPTPDPDPTTTNSVGGGCSAGFFPLALFALLFALRKSLVR